MKKSKTICFVLAILFGGFMFVYGGIDDSPGGQVIGLIVAVIGIAGLIRDWFKRRKS